MVDGSPQVDEGVDLRRYLVVFNRRRRSIGAILLSALVAGLLLSLLSPPVYESRAIINLSEQSDPLYASAAAAALVFTSSNFLGEVARAAGGSDAPADLRQAIVISPIRDTQMIRIRVRHRDPARAREIARAAAAQFLRRARVRVDERRAIIEEQLSEAQGQIQEVDRLLTLSRATVRRLERDPRPGSSSDASFALDAASISQELREHLRGSRNQLRRDLADLQFPVAVEMPAANPLPVARRMRTTVGLAALLGLIAGGAAALLLEYLGERPRHGATLRPALTPLDPTEPGA